MWVLELNDVSIRVLEDGVPKYTAPGIALVEQERFLFGLEANAQFRVNPSICYAHYVQKLNQERISSNRRITLTQADLLYHHLLQVQTRANVPRNKPIWVVVPSDTTLEQVGLLLSVLKAADFNPIDFIDTGLAASTIQQPFQEATLFDIGLNRTTVAQLESSSHLRVTNSQSVSGVGLVALLNKWISVVANRSLAESRFDPCTFGETEQQVFDQLIEGILDRAELLTFNINHAGENRHVAVLPADLADAATSHYETIVESAIRPNTAVLTPFISHLPGFVQFLTQRGFGVQTCKDDWVVETIQRLPERTDLKAEDRSFWREIELTQPSTDSIHPTLNTEPTHLLNDGIAQPLSDTHAVYTGDRSSKLFTLAKKQRTWVLEPNDRKVCEVNGSRILDHTQVSTGTTIRIDNQEFTLISVLHG